MNMQIVTINGRKYEYKGYVINPKIGTPGVVQVGTFHLFTSLEGYSPILRSENQVEGIKITPFISPFIKELSAVSADSSKPGK